MAWGWQGNAHNQCKALVLLTKEGNHCQATVLDLSSPEAEGLLLILGGEAEGVKGTTGVAALLKVELSVAVELSASNQEDLNPDQLGQAEWQRQAGVGGAVHLNLASVHPGRH
jgi:hypothetical protein